MARSKTIGILLAGGRSRRYGSPKMFSQIEKKYFYEIAYEAMSEYVDEIIIVSRLNLIERFPNCYNVITDVQQFTGMGPLAGIYSVMAHKEAKQYVVLPCDMPLINASIIKQLLQYSNDSDITVVKINDEIQPLISVWQHIVKDDIYDSLKANKKKVKDFLLEANTNFVNASSLTDDLYRFMNVNTPQDDEELRKWIKL